MNLNLSRDFKDLETTQQVAFANKVVEKLISDQRFFCLQSHTRELKAKLSEWKIAIVDAKAGGKMKAIRKIEKGLTVLGKLNYLVSQMEMIARAKNEFSTSTTHYSFAGMHFLNSHFDKTPKAISDELQVADQPKATFIKSI